MKRMQFLAVVAAGLLSACGGGSNNINFDRGALMFTGAYGATIPSQKIVMTVGLGTSGSTRYVGIDNKSPSLVNVNYDITHIDAVTVTVAPVPGLARGTYNGSADILVCSDVACKRVEDHATFRFTIVIS